MVDGLKDALTGRMTDIDEIYTAGSAEVARLTMKSFPVDILLTDIEMPEENGLALFKWAMKEYPETVGIFLTSHAEFEYAREAIRLGGFDYILQPARMEEIESVLARAVQEARKKKQAIWLERSGFRIHDQREMMLELLLIKTREGNRDECERIYGKLESIVSEEDGRSVFWTARIRIVHFEKKNNAWDADLIKMVFRNVLEELLEPQKASVMAAREDIVSYFLAAAVQEGRLEEAQWKKALETFTSFINNHMDFEIAVFPDPRITRIYDAGLPDKKKENRPGLHWKEEESGEDGKTADEDIAARIRKAQDYIRENIGRSITRTEVAQYLHINEDYFTRCFKKITGYTFKDYDILVRMETAKNLLEQTKLPVSMIAGKVGFDNFSHFSQSFRKYSGKTPSDYR